MNLSWFALCVFVAGCSAGPSNGRLENFKPIEGGFGYGQHSEKTYPMHSALRVDLQYRDQSGKTMVVWPYLELIQGNPAITNNVALLVGGKAELYDDGVERLRERLIGFDGPSGPPLDITDPVLQKYCAENGVIFTNVIKDSFASIIRTNNDVQILFNIIKIGERGPDTINAHDATMTISWHDIEAIMDDVKKNGKLKKEKWSGIEYLQKE
ncbi:MAG TPA: hypothetical protein VN625_05710 [Desulfuromonadaceae bacterium]|nr:hypothetical protein [Desulfuromonadaceae bacterium]